MKLGFVRLEMRKLLHNGGKILSGIFWSCSLPLHQHFLYNALTKKTLFGSIFLGDAFKWNLIHPTQGNWFEFVT
jgi:hypothetical protein